MYVACKQQYCETCKRITHHQQLENKWGEYQKCPICGTKIKNGKAIPPKTRELPSAKTIRALRILVPEKDRPSWDKMERDFGIPRTMMIEILNAENYWDEDKQEAK